MVSTDLFLNAKLAKAQQACTYII